MTTMTEQDEERKARQELVRNLTADLRDKYPYLKSEALASMVDEFQENIDRRLDEQLPIMAASKARMSFMSLPTQLRNYVYELSMIPDPSIREDCEKFEWRGGEPAVVIQSKEVKEYGLDQDNPFKFWRQPAITKISHQVQSESLPVYYGGMKFRIYLANLNNFGDNLEEFAYRAGKRCCGFIKHVEVFFENDCYLSDEEIKAGIFIPCINTSCIKIWVLKTIRTPLPEEIFDDQAAEVSETE